MSADENALGRPVSPNWPHRPIPGDEPLEERACRVVRLDPPAHDDALHYERWLDAGNFDAAGRQRRSLGESMHEALVSGFEDLSGPAQ